MKTLMLILFVAFFAACAETPKNDIEMPYSKDDFEEVIDGKTTRLFSMENENGMVVTLTNYGAKIVSVYVPDKEGDFDDVVLGFKSIEEYQQYGASHGAVVGPFANRIANAQFTIDGETYNLPVNNGEACLHSGPESWYRKVWDAEKNGNMATFTVESPDGENGFPGKITGKVTYTLTNDNELKLDYEVSSEKPTHINVTNHSYFNLRGEGNGDILDHVVPVGERIEADNPQLIYGSGYDFNYVINKAPGELAFAASAFEPESGRCLEVFTTEPGIQFYTGNFLKGNEIGQSDVPYTERSGFCLETQHFPDSPNHPDFPSTLLKPGEVYKSTTIFKFSVKE